MDSLLKIAVKKPTVDMKYLIPYYGIVVVIIIELAAIYAATGR